MLYILREEPSMRSIVLLCVGGASVFAAHVALPFLFVSASRSGWIPRRLDSLTNMVDPAIWLILLPFVIAFFGYNYVFGRCGMSDLAKRPLIRWVMAFVAALSSLWLEMFVVFNTFGS
jgi:hypothetical protein